MRPRAGPIIASSFGLPTLAAAQRKGQEIPVERAEGRPGRPAFSTVGLLPGAWERVADSCAVGDVVQARVKKFGDHYVVVDLLPGASAIVHVSEIDWSFVKHPADVLEKDEVVPVELLELDVQAKTARGSIRQGRKCSSPKELLLIEGGRPFTAPARLPEAPADHAVIERTLRERVADLESQLDAASHDRGAALRELREARREIAELRRSLRESQSPDSSARDDADADADDALSSEPAFLRAVRVAHARMFEEDDRFAHPLMRLRVGREFLASVRRLEGIPVSKVVEVCAQVGCGQAHEVPGRDVHPLRTGDGGAPHRFRTRDGARAWRCSLQHGSPSARRLHWWDVHENGARRIELACVGLHDDFGIPE